MSQARQPPLALSCPLPISDYPKVTLAHGGGGRLTHQLIEKIFVPCFSNPLLEQRHDGAIFAVPPGRLALTTDSYVVHPLFFPGGDIGSLAVNGTVNDLAMCGARPLYLSAGFIIEEGLEMETLWRVARSMRAAAAAAGVAIVTGDTKVVDKGKGDGLFINTAGVGVLEHERVIAPASVRPGDAVLLSGDLGRHGVTIMAEREGLAFESTIESDCAPLSGVVLALLEAGVEVRCLRDLTRGGLGTTLLEIAEATRLEITIEETQIPVCEEVRGACELLGLDPLYVANEGRFIALVAPESAEQAVAIMRAHAVSAASGRIGTVGAAGAAGTIGRGRAVLKNRLGASRLLDMPSGEQLPRIC